MIKQLPFGFSPRISNLKGEFVGMSENGVPIYNLTMTEDCHTEHIALVSKPANGSYVITNTGDEMLTIMWNDNNPDKKLIPYLTQN